MSYRAFHYPFGMRAKSTIFRGILVALAITLVPISAISAQKITPGSTCKVLKQKTVYLSKTYTCVKSGKKLVWDKGVVVVKPTPTPTPTPSASPSATSTASSTASSTYKPIVRQISIQPKTQAENEAWDQAVKSANNDNAYKNCELEAKSLSKQEDEAEVKNSREEQIAGKTNYSWQNPISSQRLLKQYECSDMQYLFIISAYPLALAKLDNKPVVIPTTSFATIVAEKNELIKLGAEKDQLLQQQRNNLNLLYQDANQKCIAAGRALSGMSIKLFMARDNADSYRKLKAIESSNLAIQKVECAARSEYLKKLNSNTSSIDSNIKEMDQLNQVVIEYAAAVAQAAKQTAEQAASAQAAKPAVKQTVEKVAVTQEPGVAAKQTAEQAAQQAAAEAAFEAKIADSKRAAQVAADAQSAAKTVAEVKRAAQAVEVVDDGKEEAPTATLTVSKKSDGKFLFTISSNIADDKLVISAVRKGFKTISFNVKTDTYGNALIITSRKLSGFALKLSYKNDALDTVKVK